MKSSIKLYIIYKMKPLHHSVYFDSFASLSPHLFYQHVSPFPLTPPPFPLFFVFSYFDMHSVGGGLDLHTVR